MNAVVEQRNNEGSFKDSSSSEKSGGKAMDRVLSKTEYIGDDGRVQTGDANDCTSDMFCRGRITRLLIL